MLQHTKGFNSAAELARHFHKHKALLGVVTEDEYETVADSFLGEPKPANLIECRRASDKKLMRFDLSAQRFGILGVDGVIVTFYALSPPARNAAWFQKRCSG